MHGIVRAEQYNFAIMQDSVDAAFFGRMYILVPCIHKGNDEDTEHVFIKRAMMFLILTVERH
jgi:hypothetical protein